MHIVIGACGWQHEQWQGAFYPEDIPPDWRLSYYANEFKALLVPFESWLECELEEIVSWIDDLHENFELFFEVDTYSCNDNVKKMLSHEVFVNRQVRFVSKPPIQISKHCHSQQGVILDHEPIGESVILLRCFSDKVIKLEEIREIIEKAKGDYREYDSIYLFFDQALADMSILNAAKIIADLLIDAD